MASNMKVWQLNCNVNNTVPISMRTSGLVLHTNYRFLGANPERLEIKGPYSLFGQTVTQACSKQ